MKLPIITETPLTTGASAVYPYSKKMARPFSRASRFGDAYDLFRVEGEHLHLPRGICPVGSTDHRVSGGNINVTLLHPPRNDEQARVCAESAALAVQGESFIVSSPTGSGKTFVGCSIIAAVQKKTLVIITKNDIESQWRKSFMTFLGIKPQEIGYIQADKCVVSGKKVVIGMVHSLCKDGRYPDWVYQEFGLILVDEVHRMGADQFANSMWQFPARLRIGLSATPDRKDGKSDVFFSHIGPVRVTSEALPLIPKVLRLKTGMLITIPHGPGKTMHIDKILSKNPNRNAKIADLVYKAYHKDRNIVIFSSLTNHLDILYNALISLGVPAKDMGFYVGGLTESQRDIAKAKNVVLATYAMCSEATDAPWWDTAVLATPRSDVVQIVGRVLREYEGKCSATEDVDGARPPIVIDLVDSSPVFKGYAQKRLNWYYKVGAIIKQIE